MSLSIYMDVNIPYPITLGLRSRAVTVLRAQEDRAAQLPDPDLLDRATALGHVLFTHDEDFLAEAARRQAAGIPFAGVIYTHQTRLTIGQCVDDLELLAKVYDPADLENRVVYLPL